MKESEEVKELGFLPVTEARNFHQGSAMGDHDFLSWLIKYI